MKWYLLIFLVPVALGIVLLVIWGFFENRNLAFPKPVPQEVNQIIPTHPSSSVPIYSASPSTPIFAASSSPQQSAPPVASSSSMDITSWKTYKLEKYKFEIRYPPEWHLSTNVTEPYNISYKPALDFINIVSGRKTGSQLYPEYQTVPVTIAVYANPSNSSLSQWLSFSRGDLTRGQPGKIHQAFARAYVGNEGLVSFSESRKLVGNVTEIGYVSAGILFYSGFFSSEGLPFIYLVEMQLPFHKWAEPSDTVYADKFSRMLSTVTLSQ